MVREFRLLNEKGQEYSLMDIINYALLTDPEGLGYSYSTEYEQLENTFIEKVRKIEQGQIAGTINFLTYDNYKNFVDFVERAQTLRFAYKIPFKNEKKEFLKDVNIQSLSKSEKKTAGAISENIIFDCLGLWYEEDKKIYSIEPQKDEIRWDYKWDSRFADYDTRKLQYINQGHIEAPIIISIDGHIINPVLSLYVEGELIQQVKINVEIGEYEKFLYNSKENEFYIRKQKADGTTESLFSLDYIDFENDNVIRIPTNKSCELKLTADNEILRAEITVLPQYKII